MDLGALRRPHGMVAIGGKAYFTAEANKLIGRLDPQTGAVDWLMGTGQEATHMLVVNKDETRIFTANIRGDSVSALANDAGYLTAEAEPLFTASEAANFVAGDKAKLDSALQIQPTIAPKAAAAWGGRHPR